MTCMKVQAFVQQAGSVLAEKGLVLNELVPLHLDSTTEETYGRSPSFRSSSGGKIIPLTKPLIWGFVCWIWSNMQSISRLQANHLPIPSKYIKVLNLPFIVILNNANWHVDIYQKGFTSSLTISSIWKLWRMLSSVRLSFPSQDSPCWRKPGERKKQSKKGTRKTAKARQAELSLQYNWDWSQISL